MRKIADLEKEIELKSIELKKLGTDLMNLKLLAHSRAERVANQSRDRYFGSVKKGDEENEKTSEMDNTDGIINRGCHRT